MGKRDRLTIVKVLIILPLGLLPKEIAIRTLFFFLGGGEEGALTHNEIWIHFGKNLMPICPC